MKGIEGIEGIGKFRKVIDAAKKIIAAEKAPIDAIIGGSFTPENEEFNVFNWLEMVK